MATDNRIFRDNLKYLFGTLQYGENIKFVETIGVAPSTLTKWKQGKHLPDRHDKEQIAEYFGISMTTLLNKSLQDCEKTSPELFQKKNLLKRQIDNMENGKLNRLFPELEKTLGGTP